MARILAVEDASELITFYRRVFNQHKVIAVGTAWDAIATLERDHDFDLVLLDMHLPEVSGMVVLQHIRKMPTGKALNVFVISADDSLRSRAELVGIQQWMTKPVEIDELIDKAEPYLKTESSGQDAATPRP